MKTSGLYFIKDRVSGVPVSGIIQCMNDIVAIKGFVNFCKSDKINPVENELYKIAVLDEDNKIVEAFSDIVFIARGDKAEEVYNDYINSISEE